MTKKKPTPESADKGVGSASNASDAASTPMARFKALAKGVIAVPNDKFREEVDRYEQEKVSRKKARKMPRD